MLDKHKFFIYTIANSNGVNMAKIRIGSRVRKYSDFIVLGENEVQTDEILRCPSATFTSTSCD